MGDPLGAAALCLRAPVAGPRAGAGREEAQGGGRPRVGALCSGLGSLPGRVRGPRGGRADGRAGGGPRAPCA